MFVEVFRMFGVLKVFGHPQQNMRHREEWFQRPPPCWRNVHGTLLSTCTDCRPRQAVVDACLKPPPEPCEPVVLKEFPEEDVPGYRFRAPPLFSIKVISGYQNCKIDVSFAGKHRKACGVLSLF